MQLFKDATLFFSRGTPSIATVILAMDHIDEHLATAATSDKYCPAIKAALAIGKKTINRYYDKSDHSEVFRIAMGQWFCIFYVLSNAFFSSSSAAQTPVLQECWVVRRVDCDCEDTRTRRI
jgi:hypothetical protein